MVDFIYDIPTKVYFGKDKLGHLGEELKKYGNKVLLTYGGGSIKKIGLYDKVIAELKKSGIEVFELSGIEPNPRVESVREGARLCKEHNIDVVLAVGGGSTIDAAKFIAASALVDHDPWDFLAHQSTTPINGALPIFSVLTLSATGSEMNTAAVISNTSTNDKKGRRDNHLFPKVSFLDPTNTYTVSQYQTACGSVDIMAHLMEVYFDTEKDLYLYDVFIEGMLKTVIKYAPIAMKDPENYEARANLMWTSSWAINSFIRSGKTNMWTCHPVEHQLSAVYDITHGHGLAILFPRWLEFCLDESRVDRYYQFGTSVFGIDPSLPPMEVAKKSIDMLADFFFNTLGLDSTLTDLGIDDTHFEEMAKKATMNVRQFKDLSTADIVKIYEMCL